MTRLFSGIMLVLLWPAAGRAMAQERVDWEMVTRIREEAFKRSKVMETTAYLTEVIGPRLTGSPQMKLANEWTRDQLEKWGLENAVLEPWGEFGRGWSFSRVAVHMLGPHRRPLFALPKAWTPGTDGPLRGPVMRVAIASEDDMEKYRGKLEGKILLVNSDRELGTAEEALYTRYSDEELATLGTFEIRPDRLAAFKRRYKQRLKLRKALIAFLKAENALATIEKSSRDGGIVRVTGGGSRKADEDPGVPALVMASEHYHAISRLLDRDLEVRLEIEVEATFHDGDAVGYNTVAEIPGTAKKNREVVMVGAHLDSWHAGTGATDNASSCAVMMEAVRILKALDVRAPRTIRIALWSGEEQGLLGSRGYVKKHFAARPDPEDPEQLALPEILREYTGPLELKPDHERLSAYFNLDNGSGRIRGIYAQENAGVKPIFETWLTPFEDMGATTVTMRNTSGTDHLSFDAVGLPGFQFIQDRLNYLTQTHHSHLDLLDYVPKDDLMQASAVVATFLYHAATRPQRLPRKSLPREPSEENGHGVGHEHD